MYETESKFVVSHDHKSSYSVQNHLHPCYEIVVYRKGDGISRIGGKDYSFHSGTFSLIEPNVLHGEEGLGPVDLIYIGFVAKNLDQPLLSGVYEESRFDILKDMELIQKEMESQSPYYGRMLNLLTEKIILSLQRGFTSIKNEKSDPFAYVESFIKLNCMKNISMELIAQNFGFSYDYFRRAFKARYGMPIKDYFMNEKIRYSVDLLKNTNHSVKEISSMCGFSSPSHFVFCFRNKMGVTPKAFVEEFRSGKSYPEIADFQKKEAGD